MGLVQIDDATMTIAKSSIDRGTVRSHGAGMVVFVVVGLSDVRCVGGRECTNRRTLQ